MYRPRRGGSGVEKGGDACVALVPNTITAGDACVALAPNTNTVGTLASPWHQTRTQVGTLASPWCRTRTRVGTLASPCVLALCWDIELAFEFVVEPWASPF